MGATTKRRSPTQKSKRQVPQAALHFDLDVTEFALDEGAGSAHGVPVTIKARGGDPIEHWYWGRVAHDLAGMQLHKPRLALDYMHDPNKLIGYLDEFDTAGGDLVVRGAILPEHSAVAAQILRLASAGVPYEASIQFDGPLRIEEVAEGKSANVNGRTIEGPATIFRRWTLRGVAICPHGADPNTKTNFSTGEEVTLTIIGGSTMALSEQEREQVDAPRNDTLSEIRRYRDAFGSAGIDWYIEGKSFAESQELFIGTLKARIDEFSASLKDAEQKRDEFAEKLKEAEKQRDELATKLTAVERERDDLKAKLAAIDRGELEPLRFSLPEGEDRAERNELATRLGPNLGLYASWLKMPKNGRPARQ